MPKHTKISPLPAPTVGLDLSDRTLRSSQFDAASEILRRRAAYEARSYVSASSAQPAGTRVALGPRLENVASLPLTPHRKSR